jgi:hypothetical protein
MVGPLVYLNFELKINLLNYLPYFFPSIRRRRRRPRQGWYAQEKSLKIDPFRFEILGLRPTYKDQAGLKVFFLKYVETRMIEILKKKYPILVCKKRRKKMEKMRI